MILDVKSKAENRDGYVENHLAKEKWYWENKLVLYVTFSFDLTSQFDSRYNSIENFTKKEGKAKKKIQNCRH